ncbi:MAG: integrase core domain-containing protein [Candidatus Dormibacteria bacterium]
MTQQARNLAWRIGDGEIGPTILIRDRDSKFTAPFDEVLRTEAVDIVRIPPRAPRANAFAERWVQSARREVLDRMLIFSERHLRVVMSEYVDHHNHARPHRGLDLGVPIPTPDKEVDGPVGGPVVLRTRLGGVLHEYSRLAA